MMRLGWCSLPRLAGVDSRRGRLSCLLGALLAFTLSACGAHPPYIKNSSASPEHFDVTREYYPVVRRRSTPEPVYGRMMWSHLPEPSPLRSKNTAPMLLPVLEFELPKSSLGESVEALAQAIGFRWDYPEALASRPVSIRMSGTVEEVLREISRQANVSAELDHDLRVVRVLDAGTRPQLFGK